MKKELGHFLWMAIIMIIWGFICHFILGVGKTTYEIKTVEFEPLDAQKTDIKVYTAEEIMDAVVRKSQDERKTDTGFTQKEAEMLMKIAMAEAEADGVEGQTMVMAVILNRVKDSRFPNTIEEVIFQDHQFSPISDGRYFEAVPDVNSHLALAEIEKEGCNGIDALYFENAASSWQADNCEYVATVGHHRFYKN